jgi:nitrate reductase gamma subunit
MLAPYVMSLARVAPQTESLASTPFLMRLHIFCAFAIVAIAPFTGLGLMVAIPVVRMTRYVVVPPSLACRQLARGCGEWMAKTAKGVSSWDEEEI